MRLIDADELIKNIDCSADMGGALGKVVECVKYYAKFMVASAPTIEERKTGKWIDGKVKHIKNGELRNVRECSECGSSYFIYDNYNSVDDIPKYCPNCGAQMEE